MPQKKSGRVTIKDVAKLANVTPQTVSRVMRQNGYVSNSTKEKVLNAAASLSYIPSYAAKALRNGMRKSIAVVFDSLINVYFAFMLDYLRKHIAQNGYSIQLLFSNDVVITEDLYRKAVSHGAVAVISFIEGKEGIGQTVKSCGVPLIIFGRSTTEEGLDYITTDDVLGGRIVGQRLLDNGCTSFKYVVEGSGMTCALDRLQGFSEVLKENGYEPEIIDVGTYGKEALNAVDFTNPKVGVFCFSDQLAFHIVKNMGLKDIKLHAKIIGYDNIQADMILPVEITTVGIDKNAHTKFAIECVVKKIQNPSLKFAEHQAVKLFEGITA